MVMPALRRANGYSIGPAQAQPDPDIGPVDLPLPQSPSRFIVGADGTSSIQLTDGTVVLVQAGAKPTGPVPLGEGFDENLADHMDDGQLTTLAMDLLEGIRADEMSRASLVHNYTKGLDLLALTVEDESQTRQRKRTSKVRNPVMLDAVVKFWAAAQPELLPASGPCKVRDDAQSNEQRDELAAAFERDMNHYLTVTAKEYYEDTAQMLMLLGFGGTTFKKVYRCPLRERPVSESVRLPDLIVSEQATDLDNAIRVTHQILMPPSNIRRLQLAGFYREVELGQPMPPSDPTRAKENMIHGLATTTMRPQDQDRTLYECYTDLDPDGYGIPESKVPKRLPLPYRVTIDKDAQQILEIRRNWREDDKKFRKRQRFVKYTLVPGFGFLGLGFLHLLGNQTKALTALWRIMIDCGMFGAFPGGVKVKGTRQSTNEIAPGPGEWVEVDTGPIQRIQDALMPMPYKELNPVLIQLSEMISAHAEKLGTSIEFPTGEGRTNIPVGTIMAMIEQQTQVMAAVHKGLHRAQQAELLAFKELFAEDPEALWKHSPDPARQWQDPAEILDQRLVPASDPNVPSQIHRIMVATALVTLATTNPDIYNRIAVHRQALHTIGRYDADALLQNPQAQQPGMDAEALGKAGELQLKQQELQVKQTEQQRKAANEAVQTQQRSSELNLKAGMEAQDRASKERIAGIQEETERMRLEHERQQDAADRHQQSQQHAMGLAAQNQQHTERLAHEHRQAEADRQHQAQEHAQGLAADQQSEATRLAHERQTSDLDRQQRAQDAQRKFGSEQF